MKRLFVTFFCFLFIDMLIAQTNIFDWTKFLPNLPSRPEYLQGLGFVPKSLNTVDDQKVAVNLAISQIAMQLRVQVQSSIETSIKEKMVRSKETNFSESFEAYSQIASSFSNETLKNINVEKYYDKDSETLYAYAYISKIELKKQIEDRINNSVQTVLSYYKNGLISFEKNNISTAFTELITGLRELAFSEKLEDTPLMFDFDNVGKSEPIKSKVIKEIRNILENIKIEVISGDKQKGERNKPLTEKLVGKILFVKASKSLPISYFSLRSSVHLPTTLNIDSITITDAEGRFIFTVNQIISGAERNKINILIDTSNIYWLSTYEPMLYQKVLKTGCNFEFYLTAKTNIVIAIEVLQEYDNSIIKIPIVKSEIQKKLVAEGYQVIDDVSLSKFIEPNISYQALKMQNEEPLVTALRPKVDYLILGTVIVTTRDSPVQNILLAYANGSIRVIETKTNQLIFNSGERREKSSGTNNNTAIEKALKIFGESISSKIVHNLNNALK